MRIGLISTVATPVSDRRSGSIEQIVWLLARELARRRHDVTVFGCEGSRTEARLVTTLPGPYGREGSPPDWRLCEWVNLAQALRHSSRFDVIHSHGYLLGVPLEPLSAATMVHTLHVMPYEDEARLVGMMPAARVTAISHYQWSRVSSFRPTAVVPYGLDPGFFTFRAEPDDYICYLGRFTPGKGALLAVEIARALGVRVLLAGPRNRYFDEKVRPLVDGRAVEYVGWVTSEERDALLGRSRALVYPLIQEEPFGLVQVEAMMCGTPVLGARLGATPEIVEEGVTGYLGDDVEELVQHAPAAFALPRERIRANAVARFSVERMTDQYLAVYSRLLNEDGES